MKLNLKTFLISILTILLTLSFCLIATWNVDRLDNQVEEG